MMNSHGNICVKIREKESTDETKDKIGNFYQTFNPIFHTNTPI